LSEEEGELSGERARFQLEVAKLERERLALNDRRRDWWRFVDEILMSVSWNCCVR
jgi:hypothetical protein